MIKIVRKLNPFSTYEIEYLESWLSDMAKQGLIVDNITLWFATFAQVEPRNRRYRILPKAFGDVSDEEKDFYSQQLWHFDFSFSGLNVFYTDSDNADELFTDEASFNSYTKRYALFTTLSIIALIPMWYILLTRNLDIAGLSMPPLHVVQQLGLMLTILTVLLLVLIIFALIRTIFGSASLIIKIKKNIKLNHDKPYKNAYRIYKFITALMIVTMVGIPVGMIVSHNFPSTTITYAETIAYNGTHPVMFREIDQENWISVQKCIDTEIWSEDIGYTIDSYWDGLFKRIVTEDVRIDEATNDGIVYIATYYNARSVGIALRYLREDIPYHIDEDVTMDDIKIKCDVVDYAGYYSSTRDSFQYLFVLNGTQLETVVYQGEKNLKDYLKLYIDDLSNK